MKVALLTAIYDNYDTLKPVLPQEGVEVEWILVTDTAPDIEAAAGYEIIQERWPNLHPNRAAKRPKLWPWAYTDVEASVWIDASYRVTSPYFVADVMRYANPIAQFVHPWRDCVYREAEESVKLVKYKGEPCMKQVDEYKYQGFPERFGLWATGVIARYHTPKIKEMSDVWATEILNGSFQDQLSHPYALWSTGLRPTSLPGNHLSNPYLSYEGSGRH